MELGSGFRGPGGQVGYLLRQAQQAMRTAMDNTLHELGVTAAQYSILSILQNQPGLSGAQLAHDSMLTAQTVNEMLLALERGGLVERVPAATDRRVREAFLTPTGRTVAAQARRRVHALEARMLHTLNEPERTSLNLWLVACARSLTEPDLHSRPTAPPIHDRREYRS